MQVSKNDFKQTQLQVRAERSQQEGIIRYQ